MSSDDKERSAEEFRRDLEVYQDRARFELREQVRVWNVRAGMAKQQGNQDLVRIAMDMVTAFRNALDALGPDPDGPPDDPAGVPRKPLPLAGGSAVALPLPKPEEP